MDDDARIKNPDAAALGRLGGLKGGRARAAALSPEQRRKIARKAARARWRRARQLAALRTGDTPEHSACLTGKANRS